MARGNYLVRGDKTTCGGIIVEGCENHCLFGQAISREGDKVTCGKHSGMYNIVGGIASDSVHGRRMAGTQDSYSSCPCRSLFIASMVNDTYEKISGERFELQQYGQAGREATGDIILNAVSTKEKKSYTSKVMLITSTIIEKYSTYEIAGDHSAVYFEVKNDPLSPYLFDPNGSYNPYKRLENGHGQRGSGFLFKGEFADLNNFVVYQENPNGDTKDDLENEWFPYKVKIVVLPVTNDESEILRNAANLLDDSSDKPGAFSCAVWSSKLLQHIEPELDTYTLPGSLRDVVVRIRERRLNGKVIVK